MNIIIPGNIDTGDLKVLPNGVAVAVLEKVILGKSRTGNPKLTLRYTITEEMETPMPDGSSVIGETVLETVSLQPQALFNLARIWKDATGEQLPQGDYSEEAFTTLLSEQLCGTEWNLMLEAQMPSDGSSTELRTNIVKRVIRKR